MLRMIRLSSVLAFAAFLGTGCMAEMGPDGQPGPDQAEDGPADPTATGDESPAAEPSSDETVAESSEALSSCATSLVCSNGQLTVYENSDCSGGKMYFCPGDYPDLTKITTNLYWFANWNDRISIMSTTGSPHKVAVWAYQHVGYKGDVRYFPPGTWTNLGGGLWNDQISSIKVRAVK
jgi:hypothetical protein